MLHTPTTPELLEEQAEEIAKLRQLLRDINHTICIHGHIDRDTPLHERIHLALADSN